MRKLFNLDYNEQIIIDYMEIQARRFHFEALTQSHKWSEQFAAKPIISSLQQINTHTHTNFVE